MLLSIIHLFVHADCIRVYMDMYVNKVEFTVC